MKKLSGPLLLCALLACGGGGSSGVDSGLPADKQGNQLASADSTTLCEASAEHYASLFSEDDLHSQACTAEGFTVAAMGNGSVETCKFAYDLCIKKAYEPETSEPTDCVLFFDLLKCKATVADIEACLTAKNEMNADDQKAQTCDILDDPPATGEPPVPAACSKISADCPGIA